MGLLFVFSGCTIGSSKLKSSGVGETVRFPPAVGELPRSLAHCGISHCPIIR